MLRLYLNICSFLFLWLRIYFKILSTNSLCHSFFRLNFLFFKLNTARSLSLRLNYEIIITFIRSWLFNILKNMILLLLVFINFLHHFTWYHLRSFKIFWRTCKLKLSLSWWLNYLSIILLIRKWFTIEEISYFIFILFLIVY